MDLHWRNLPRGPNLGLRTKCLSEQWQKKSRTRRRTFQGSPLNFEKRNFQNSNPPNTLYNLQTSTAPNFIGIVDSSSTYNLFASTLTPQLRALHDFDVIFGALRTKGVDLNRLADAINQGVPVYASPQAQRYLDSALRALTPFANNLADLFILNRADWDRMMGSGDAVLQTIALRPEQLHELIQGLYRYVYRLGGDPYGLQDGSAAAAFVNFIGGSSSRENQRQLCGALPPQIRDQIQFCRGV